LGWFSGQVVVGGGHRGRRCSRRAFAPRDAPARGIPALIADLKDGHVDPRLVPGIAVVSAESLIGGAKPGPGDALGSMGGGACGWVSQRPKLGQEDLQLGTLSGFGGPKA
jgi:hypothetical protein